MDTTYNQGHRQRLKARFLQDSSDKFASYELLELLLFYSNPRRDVKPLAKSLLARFDNIADILAASPETLQEFIGLGENSIILFKLIKEILTRQSFDKIQDRPILSSWLDLMNYLYVSMGHNEIEELKIMYLDKKFKLIKAENVGIGTIDQVAIYPREIVKKALFYNATEIILAHNHPSGDVTPSKKDIEFTKAIIQALKTVNIKVHDHVIISKNNHYSFAMQGLINI